MRKLSWLLIIGGAVLSIGSFWRYYIYYSDHSQALIGILLGLTGIGFGIVYDWITELKEDVKSMNRKLEAQGALITGNKKLALEQEATIGDGE